MRNCRQLIVVTVETWDDFQASIRLHERKRVDDPDWREIRRFQGVLGRSGLGWGIGLHGTGEPGTPRKREGDSRSPAGVFELGSIFGRESPSRMTWVKLTYQQMTATCEAIDDPKSRFYNRIVDRETVPKPDWSHSERMLVGVYRLGVVLKQNWQAVPDFGSCIFLHIWDRDRQPTRGCTAMARPDLERMVRWLDPAKNPLIVQLPGAEYARWQQAWQLPHP
jgi:D-alanyl-D-alanine dipeptidase